MIYEPPAPYFRRYFLPKPDKFLTPLIPIKLYIFEPARQQGVNFHYRFIHTLIIYSA